jgi:HK97 family phage major capsid protein
MLATVNWWLNFSRYFPLSNREETMSTKHETAPSLGKSRGITGIYAEAPNVLNAEARQLMADLGKTFADFRTANDERIAAMEKGLTDVVTNEKVDRINSEVTNLQAALDKALADLASANVGGRDNADNAAKLKARAQAFFSGRSGVERTADGSLNVDAYGTYEKVFTSWLRGGDVALRQPDVAAAMQVGSDPDGGYWVPTQQQTQIITRLFETSPMRQAASVISIPTDSVTYPNDTNDGTSGGWVGETADRPETDTPQVGEQTIYVREQYAMPKVTQKLLDMASVDVEAWLNGKIADKFARTENTAFVSGSGVSSPRGFLDYKTAAVTTADASRAWGVLQYIFTGASAGFPNVSGSVANDPDKLWDVIAATNPAYLPGARWMMSRATMAAIRKLKDANGNYFVGPIQGAATGFELCGYPITPAEDMPALASDSFSAAFGNFAEGYQIVDGRGIRILRDPFTTKGRVKFYTTKFTGGDVLNFDSIKLLKFGTS